MIFPSKKLIVYELNEVPERVLTWHREKNPQSHLARLLKTGLYANTDARDEGVLSPWTTWATFHRGVLGTKHTISDFGQDLSDIDAEFPPIWDLLQKAGVSVGVFGSLHSYPLPRTAQNYSYYLPDTFAQGPEAHPDDLRVFQEFNLAMVDQSGRNVGGAKIPLSPAVQFLKRAPALGLSPRTVARLGAQVLNEQRNKVRKVRRRTSQVEIAFDIFLKKLRSHRPRYTSFFTNHVASTMHRYWPGTFPDDYTRKDLSADWLERYSGELSFTMDVADYQVGKLMEFVAERTEYALVVLSSMGQAAVDTDEIVKTQLFIKDLGSLLNHWGVPAGGWESARAMLPRYVFKVHDESSAQILREKIPKILVNGEPIYFDIHAGNVFMMRFGQVNLDAERLQITVEGAELSWRDFFEITPIEDATGSYAYHVPNGILAVWDPATLRSQVIEESLPTDTLAGKLMNALGVAPPAHMQS